MVIKQFMNMNKITQWTGAVPQGIPTFYMAKLYWPQPNIEYPYKKRMTEGQRMFQLKTARVDSSMTTCKLAGNKEKNDTCTIGTLTVGIKILSLMTKNWICGA